MPEEKPQKPLLGKIILKGEMECVTGLHVGASKERLEIGGIDAAVIRDPLTREPYIPGSALKGKLRSLLERDLNLPANRSGGEGIHRHECDSSSSADTCNLCRIFGSTGDKGKTNFPARLIVRDLKLTRESEKELQNIETGLQYTEWKFENTLDRVTAAANPRQLERVPKGAKFEFEFVYNIEKKEDVVTDLANLIKTLKLLEDDCLGGHGSRGYGKVEFTKIDTFETRTTGYYASTDNKKRQDCTTKISAQTLDECQKKLVELVNLLPEDKQEN
ncbi:MAG: type III-A CRISPR-associated RAMP protein Csm3 [bacterium]|nr:type III-A CRISPR-associated RAMP protein Csm3 [bacterium]